MERTVCRGHSGTESVVTMILLDTKLQELQKSGTPIRVGVVGAGYAARGFVNQLQFKKGIQLITVANRTLSRAETMLSSLKIKTISIESGKKIPPPSNTVSVTTDYRLLCNSEHIDVIVEATGDVETGCDVTLQAIENKKHIVLINAELDATLGPILKSYADQAGVVYTQTDGDQPGVIMNLIRYVRGLGMTPVLAGNIKSVFDKYRTPATQAQWAKENNVSPVLATAAVDGTKLALEMATVANAANLKISQRGMIGPSCNNVDQAATKFPLQEFLENGGVVDFIQGAYPHFGVFVIAHTNDSVQKEYLKMYKMGNGPFYTFTTPFHLCSLDTAFTVARASLFHDAAIAPVGAPVSQVITVAKRDLKAGEVLDGIGGYDCYGMLENNKEAMEQKCLPIGLSKGCTVIKDTAKDTPITYNSVTVPSERQIDMLYQKQTKLFTQQS